MYIASIATDVKIHTWPNGQLLHTYKSNIQGYMKSLSWGKDGSWLVLVPSKGPAEVISIRESLKHLHSIHEIQQPTCAAFQNNTKRNIALGTTTGMVLVYDIKSKNVRKHFPRAPSTVFKVEYCAKDSFLVAACENGEILLYNGITYNLSSSYKVPNSRTVSNVRCHPVRRNLVVGASQEGFIAMWDIHTTKLKFNNQAHSAPVTDLTFSPLRSDLLVTIGLDRKLMFFETNSNGCIMQKVMDRSATAIDFCPDGVGLAVALQDGTIQTYDTRQMNSPLYVFTAHGGQIKQLLFQKKSFDECCELTFTEDKLDSFIDIPQAIETARSGYSYDSCGQHMFCGDVLPDIPEATTEVSAEEVGDSFMGALGMNLNTTSPLAKRNSQLIIADGVKKLSDAKPNSLETQTHNKSDQQDSEEKSSRKNSGILVRKSADAVKTQTSTPKYYQPEVQPTSNISPIISGSQVAQSKHVLEVSKHYQAEVQSTSNISPIISGNQIPVPQTDSVTNLNQIDIQMIRNIVKEELKQEIETFKQHMKYEFTDIIGHMRRHFLDLQMSIVKEFVQMENHFNKLKEDIAAEECFGEDILVQENIRLRHEIQELRNQLLPANDD